MRPFFMIIVLLINGYKVESESVCALGLCGCKFNGVNVTVDCLFTQRAVESNRPLPNNTVILDLSKSNLTYLQLSELLKSDTVEELLLNNNNLQEINGNSFQLPQLKRLDLSNNYLEVIKSEVFIEIIKLEYLNLAYNKFKEISHLHFHPLVNLKEIILDNNDIGADLQNTSLFDLNGCGLSVEIESISLSEINLGDIQQDYFLPAKSLRNLTVSKNKLTQTFYLPYYIFYLDVSENPIKLLKLDYYYGSLLNILKGNNLEIETVDKNAFLATLIELQLEGNKYLTNFSHLAFGRQILIDDYDFLMTNLSVRRSNISTLNSHLWVLFNKVERLDLQDNPWTCDCRIAWFLKLKIPHYLTKDLKCASPPHLNNTRIFDLELKDFICLETIPDTSSDYQIEVPMVLVLYSQLLIIIIILICVFIYVPRPMAKRNKFTKI